MTTETYPKFLNVKNDDNSEIIMILLEIIRLRDEDITDFNNLNRRFLPGRATDRVPSSPTDVVPRVDATGDIVNDGIFEYKLINDAGDLKWDRRTLDFSW